MMTSTMNKAVVGVAFLTFAVQIAGAAVPATQVDWKSLPDGNANGSFTNVDHWTSGKVPGALNLAVFQLDKSYTVRVDNVSQRLDTQASLQFKVKPGRQIVFDGSGNELHQVATESDNYLDNAFGIGRGDYQVIQTYLQNGYEKAVSDMSDFRIAMTDRGDAAGGLFVDFEKGTYNFYNAGGTTRTTPTLYPAWRFFSASTIGAGGTSPVVRFGPDVDITLPCFWYQGNNPTNTVLFDGARAIVRGGCYFPYVQGGWTVSGSTISRFELDHGAKVTIANILYMAANGQESDNNRIYEFNVRGGSRLDTLSAFVQTRTDTRLNISGEGSEFAICGGTTWGQKANSAFSVDVTDGGTFFLTNYVSAAGNLHYWGSSASAKFRITGDEGHFIIRPPLTFYNGTVDVTNCEWTVGGAQYRIADSKGRVDMAFHGGTFANGGIHCIGWNGVATLTCDGCTMSQTSHVNVGGDYNSSATSAYLAGCTGTVNVVDGEFRITNGGVLYLGAQNGAKGVLNVSGGLYNCPSSIGTKVGYFGSGEVNVSGGVCYSEVLQTGAKAPYDADYPDDVVTVSGGELRVPKGDSETAGLEIAHDAGRAGRLVLTGGFVSACNVFGGAGTSVLSADGGTIRASAETTRLVHDFTTAEIGAKGLTIDSNGKSVTVAQTFVGKTGEAGRLVLAGDGVKTMSGDLSDLDTIEVTGGAADLCGQTVKNLILNGGTLVLDAAHPIVVTGTMTILGGGVAFKGEQAAGAVCDVLQLANPLSDASLDVLRGLMVSAGLVDGDVCDFTQVSDGKGGYLVRGTVRKAANLLIELKAGESNATERIDYNTADSLTVDVGEGASLTATGLWKRGSLTKRGKGLLTLDNANDVFIPGYSLLAGGLSVTDTAPLGLGRTGDTGKATVKSGALNVLGNASGERLGPTISLTANATDDVVVVNSAVDVTMPCPVSQNSKGELVKRGAGRLTLEVEGEVQLGGGEGAGDNSGGFWGQARGSDATPMAFDGLTGEVCNGEPQPLDVYEGELRLVGKGKDATVKVSGTTVLGRPGESGTAQPGLVLDNVKFNFSVYNRYFLVAPFLNYAYPTPTADMAKTPYLILTNNATLKGSSMQICRLNNLSSCAVTTLVYQSRMEITSGLFPHRGQVSSKSRMFFRDGSTLDAANISLFRPFEMTFDASDCIISGAIKPEAAVNISSMTGKFYFRNGSTFQCKTITFATASTIDSPMTFTFDGSAWIPSADDYTFDWGEKRSWMKIVAEGDGFELPVPDGKTWTMNQTVEGDGGIVHTGAGTLVLGADAVRYAGVTKAVEGATVDLGGNAHPLVIGGKGTFRNGTVAAGGGIALAVSDAYETEETPVLDGVSFDGRFKVDLGRTSENPLVEPFGTFAVCTYEGAAPDVSGWKLKGTGLKNTGGRFVAKDGVVTCTPEPVGLLLLVR